MGGIVSSAQQAGRRSGAPKHKVSERDISKDPEDLIHEVASHSRC